MGPHCAEVFLLCVSEIITSFFCLKVGARFLASARFQSSFGRQTLPEIEPV